MDCRVKPGNDDEANVARMGEARSGVCGAVLNVDTGYRSAHPGYGLVI
jgi:hypothetical protein